MKEQIRQNNSFEQTCQLDRDELAKFDENGWISAYPLLKPLECRVLIRDYLDQRGLLTHLDTMQQLDAISSGTMFWTKSLHAVLPKVCKVLSDPRIIDRVSSLLGKDVILWGSSVVSRAPGRTHKWHTDWEHLKWKGVTVFIGLTGTTRGSSLKVIPGSHRFMQPVSLSQRVDTDEEALIRAEQYQNAPEVKIIELQEGQFMIFDGPIWHGSKNTHSQTRFALLAQYTTPEYKVRVPLSKGMKYGTGGADNFDHMEFSPPCILVSGEDRYKHNNLVLATS